MSRAVPVRKGQEIELAIDSLSHDGQGVGRYQGFAIFVPHAVPGDQIRAEIITVQKNYARGLITKIIASSASRVNPACSIFPACGGCQLQHLSYQEQLEFKRQVVVEALARIGKLKGITVHRTLGMEEPWHYRNKAQIPWEGRARRLWLAFMPPAATG